MAVGAIKWGKRAGWNPRVGRSSLSEARWSAQFWSSGPAPRDFCSRDRVAAPNYAFHGQALIVLRALSLEHAAGNRTLLAALQRVKGKGLPASTINRQDNSLQAWSWIDDTFSWVEPTAWCLLALKQWSACPAQSPTALESSSPSKCWSTDAAQRAAGTTAMRTCSDRT